MNIEINNKGLSLNLHGFSGVAINQDYAGTAFGLMDRIWQVVEERKFKNKGKNIWVYEPDEKVFAGVELEVTPDHDTGLEYRNIHMDKYAYYKHVGAYNLIRQAGLNMIDELKKLGFETCLPYIEIYGHWTNDESKLETELLICLK